MELSKFWMALEINILICRILFKNSKAISICFIILHMRKNDKKWAMVNFQYAINLDGI